MTTVVPKSDQNLNRGSDELPRLRGGGKGDRDLAIRSAPARIS